MKHLDGISYVPKYTNFKNYLTKLEVMPICEP